MFLWLLISRKSKVWRDSLLAAKRYRNVEGVLNYPEKLRKKEEGGKGMKKKEKKVVQGGTLLMTLMTGDRKKTWNKEEQLKDK